jgi:Beta xylosidase C-terminal Concanavalin A-like domain
MMRRASLPFRLCLVLLIGLSLGVSAGARSPAIPQAGTVTIALGNPIEIAVTTCSGWSTFQDHLDAVQMAVADYGPIKGFAVQRNNDSSLCDMASGASAASAIVANAQNVGVIGPLYSSSAMGAAPVFETAGVVMISFANTRADLPTFAPNVFNRTTIPDPGGDLWAETINSLGSAITWRAGFYTTYGRWPDSFAILAYDATTLLLTRITQVSTVDGGGNLVIDRAALAAAVRNTANLPGASGPISLEVNGDRMNNYTTLVWADQYSSSTLDPSWGWIEEDPPYWSLTARPGFLRLITQQSNENRLVRNAPARNFEMRTRFFFAPTENFQFAGLYVYGDEDNFLKLGRAYCSAAPPTCVGNGIYFDRVEGGSGVGSNYAMATTVTNEAYLRIVRTGAEWTAYVSENGTTWTLVGTHTIGFTPTKIGLIASNQGQDVGEIPADFDFFVLELAAYHLYQPIVNRAFSP